MGPLTHTLWQAANQAPQEADYQQDWQPQGLRVHILTFLELHALSVFAQ